MISWRVKPLGDDGGVEGCPSGIDVCLRCGVVGRFPRRGERGAATGPAPVFRLVKQPQRSPL